MPRAMYSSICCSMWKRSSRESSVSARLRRTSDRSRLRAMSHQRIGVVIVSPVLGVGPAPQRQLDRANHEPDGVREPLPLCQLFLQLHAAGSRQAVELRLASRFGRAPLGAYPALLLEPV